MIQRKLPIKYIYFILIGISLGIVFGAKSYFSFLYWDVTEKYNWHQHFAPNLIYFSLWGFIVPIVYYFVNKYPLFPNSSISTKLKAIGISIVIGFSHEIVANLLWYVPVHFLGVEEFTKEKLHSIIGYLPSSTIGHTAQYWVIALLFMALDYYKKLQNKQVELAQLETQLSNAKLNALRLQLQPHFLFNTLNTISSLMDIDTKASQKMVSRLGDLLRKVLEQDDRLSIPLHEELTFTKNYLDIEQVRFNDRLSIEYQIDENALNALVPSLILQPLVENAIKHGFSKQTESGKITLIAKKLNEEVLELRVHDDGNGTNKSVKELLESGIGLKNVKERLEQLYKEEHIFKIISNENNSFEVILNFPYKRYETNSNISH